MDIIMDLFDCKTIQDVVFMFIWILTVICHAINLVWSVHTYKIIDELTYDESRIMKKRAFRMMIIVDIIITIVSSILVITNKEIDYSKYFK